MDWDGGDKCHDLSPFSKRRLVTPRGRSERQGVCINVEGSIGLRIVAEEAGRPCDALECRPCELLNHHLIPCCDMEGQEGATMACALFLVRDHGLTPCLLEGYRPGSPTPHFQKGGLQNGAIVVLPMACGHSHPFPPPMGNNGHSPWPNSLPSSIAQEELKSWIGVMVNMATLLHFS